LGVAASLSAVAIAATATFSVAPVLQQAALTEQQYARFAQQLGISVA
jgi:hypothetical protein